MEIRTVARHNPRNRPVRVFWVSTWNGERRPTKIRAEFVRKEGVCTSRVDVWKVLEILETR